MTLVLHPFEIAVLIFVPYIIPSTFDSGLKDASKRRKDF